MFFDQYGLTIDGAKHVLAFCERNPRLLNTIGATTQVDRLTGCYSKNHKELSVEDLRRTLLLPGDIKTGRQLADLMQNVTTGYNDYGEHVIGLDIDKVRQLSAGVGASGLGR